MPQYTVKTDNNRNLVIEADKYEYDCNANAFDFWKEGKTVATIDARSFFAIVLNDAERSDHYYVYDWNEEDEKESDICDDCKTAELLESEPFWDAVWEVVDAYHEPDYDEPIQGPEVQNTHGPEPETPDDPYPIEKWQDKFGTVWYGFHTPEGFANFFTQEGAKEGVKAQLSGNRNWTYLDLTTSTKVPDPLTLYQAVHKNSEDSPSWGFWYRDEEKVNVFVPFGVFQDAAKGALENHKREKQNFVTWALSETTPVPETIQ